LVCSQIPFLQRVLEALDRCVTIERFAFFGGGVRSELIVYRNLRQS